MRHATSFICLADIPVILLSVSACTTPPPPPAPKPPLVYADPVVPAAPSPTTDRILDHSAAHYESMRGGAAIRSSEDAYVLWNRHLGESASDIRAASGAVPSEQKSKASAAARKSSAGRTDPSVIRVHVREGQPKGGSGDASVYRESVKSDRSVYRE